MLFNFIYFLLAALGLGVLIFIHELGHYFMARRVGMRVEAFGIGFGKPIISWEHKGVRWNLCWLPFGGYVRIAGTEKQGAVEPFQIPDGFYGKTPLDRIKVAVMGPLVNLVFAFVAFALIWALGGRDKPFQEYTHLIGWIKTDSKLYELGVRPGDEITELNNHAFDGIQDLMYAAVIENKNIEIGGYKIDYATGKKEPFNYTFERSEGDGASMPSLLLSPANYLFYAKTAFNDETTPGSSMRDSGLRYGDRLAWIDGQLVFSQPQLVTIVNDRIAFLTVDRNGQIFHTRIPRLKVSDVKLSGAEEAELDDWQHEANLKKKTDQLFYIPYSLNHHNVVERELLYSNGVEENHVYTAPPRTNASQPLQKGDRIIAVDGTPVASATELLSQLQTRQVNIIVQREPKMTGYSWKEADQKFEALIDASAIAKISASIGTTQPVDSSGSYHHLKPVTPKSMAEQAAAEKLAKNDLKVTARKKQIEKIENPQTQANALRNLEASQKRLMLGIFLQDGSVLYNPSPFALFGETCDGVWRTLKGLVSGQLNPKWLSGPVGIMQVMHQGWSLGFKEAIFWLAVISINLGILNLLPFPVLDGGQICFSLWEMITKRPIKAKIMERMVIPFVVLLIGFLVYVTYQDLSRIFGHFF